MIEKFKRLKMKQQALIIQCATFTLVLIILGMLYLSFVKTSINLMNQTSYEALIRSNDERISLLSKKIDKYIEYGFFQANTSLIKIQQLYSQNYYSNYQYINCSQINSRKGKILAYCYNNKEQLNLTSDYYFKFGNLMQQIDSWLLSFQLDQFSNIQLVFRIERPHFTSIYSSLKFPYDFDVETRPFYYEHLAQNNTRYIGNPFINRASFKLALMITQTIYDNQNKDLVMAIGFQFENLNKYIALYNVKLVIVSQEGIILANNFDNTQKIQALTSILYIFNQSMIAFNHDDWNELNKYIRNQTYTSNCQQQFLKFCRNLNGLDTQIEAKIIQTKFIQIMYFFLIISFFYSFNDVQFTQEQNYIQQLSIQQILDVVIVNLIIFFSISFFILVYSTYKLSQIIKPGAKMIEIIQQQVKSQLDYTRNINNNQLQNLTYRRLQDAFRQFIKRHEDLRNIKIFQMNKYRFPTSEQIKFENLNLQLLEDQCSIFPPQFSRFKYIFENEDHRQRIDEYYSQLE